MHSHLLARSVGALAVLVATSWSCSSADGGAHAPPRDAGAPLVRCDSVTPPPATLFVSATGDDANDGRAVESALLTLARAVGAAVPGDIIEVSAGAYEGFTVAEGQSGAAGAWIEVRGRCGDRVVIDGSIGARNDAILFRHDSLPDGTKPPAYWRIVGLEIRGSARYCVKIDVPQVELLNNEMHRCGADLIKLVGTATDVLIEANHLHHSGDGTWTFQNAQAIDMVGSQRVRVLNNYVHDIPAQGVYAKGNAEDILFEGNLLVDIYDRAIMLGQSTSPRYVRQGGPYECVACIARNNVVVNSGSACVSTSAALDSSIVNNSCYNTATGFQSAIYLDMQSELGTTSCNLLVANNIVHVGSDRQVVSVGRADVRGIDTDVSICPGGIASLTIDNNVYFVEGGPPLFSWELDRGLSRVGFDEWRRVSGQDASSIVAAPGYVDPAGLIPIVETSVFDLRARVRAHLGLAAGSVAIDMGRDLPDLVAGDFDGRPRPAGRMDVGAFER